MNWPLENGGTTYLRDLTDTVQTLERCKTFQNNQRLHVFVLEVRPQLYFKRWS